MSLVNSEMMNKRLLDGYGPEIRNYTQKHRESLGSTYTFDTVDDDLMQLQKAHEESKKKAEEYEYLDQNCSEESVLYDDSLPSVDELQGDIAEKTQQIEDLKQKINDMNQRFVWDLSLAIKRKIFANPTISIENKMHFSNLSISTILDRAEKENPDPHEWKRWIEKQYDQIERKQ